MRACPALRPRRDLHVRPWVYGKSGPRLRTFRRTRLPRTMPASLLANIPTTSRYCLPYIHTTSAPTTNLFRGSITQPAHSLSTLHNMGYPNAAQDSLPAGGQPLPGGIGYPLGPTTRFQQCLITASPLSKLSWRTVGGRPRQLPAWVPRQIRTCGTTASGSSSYGFAAQRYVTHMHPRRYLPESR
jgi:hypothetical protein